MAGNGRYLRYAQEVGATEHDDEGEEKIGNPHFQGYFVLKKRWRMTQVINFIKANTHEGGHVYVAPMNGTIAENEEYLEKEGGPIETFGSAAGIRGMPKKQKTAVWRDEIKSGKTVQEVIDMEPGALLHMRVLNEYSDMCRRASIPRWRELNVSVFYGATGTGKTRLAVELDDDAYLWHVGQPEWWPGYQYQKTIVVDDFNEQLGIVRFLNLLDGYRLELPYKGGFTPAMYTTVIITSNVEPSNWYPMENQRHRDALSRRIHKEFEFMEDGCIICRKSADEDDLGKRFWFPGPHGEACQEHGNVEVNEPE